MQPRVLLIDDDFQLVRGLRASLLNEGYEAETAVNGLEGLHAARRLQPDLIVTDINMPWMDGIELCNQLRQDDALHCVPILFLTSRDSVDARIEGLDAGADDYLAKPFNTRELHARLRALLRRAPAAKEASPEPPSYLQVSHFTLDLLASCLKIGGGDRTQLTPAEFELLYFLMRHPGRTFSSEALLKEVWAYDPDMSDLSLVRWHIRNLRAKIEPDPSQPTYLRTVPRHGYILEL